MDAIEKIIDSGEAEGITYRMMELSSEDAQGAAVCYSAKLLQLK